MSTTTLVEMVECTDDARDEIAFYLRFCSMPTLFDPWTNVVHLYLDHLSIVGRLADRIKKFVKLPFAKDPTTGTSSGEEVRWIDITMGYCEFHCDAEEVFTYRDIHKMFSAIADRTRRLKFIDSPEMVRDFLETPDIGNRAVQRLHIDQDVRLPTEDYYTTLDYMIDANHLQFRELYLHLPLGEEAQGILCSVANAINMEELSFRDTALPRDTQAGIIAGGIDPLIQLLQNPQNRLKKLGLAKLGLQDKHFIAISELLPSSQIEFFDFSQNMIQSAGMMEFVGHLSKMDSLKYLRFGSNRWQESANACHTIGDALLQHVLENAGMESVDDLDGIAQAPLLWNYLVVNRAGRRLLTSSHPVPDGLWSHVLERASDGKRYTIGEVEVIVERDSDEKRYTNGEMGGRVATEGVHIARYNAVYFLLHNILQRYSPSA